MPSIVGPGRWAVALLVLLGACAPAATPSATSQPTSRFATVEGTVIRQTLPPTWTPSDTPTRTPTRTPTPIPSITPTQTADDICAGFELLHDFTAQHAYAWESYIPIIASLSSSDSTIHFSVVQRRTGQGKGFDFPGGQAAAIEFHINTLPQPGIYDWQLGVRHPVYGDICQREGWFIALRPQAIAMPEATAEATTEATPETTVEATPDITAEATAEATVEITPETTAEAG